MTEPFQIAPLLVLAAGIVFFTGGTTLRHRGVRIGGRILTGIGIVVGGGAVVGALALAPSLLGLVSILLCSIGVALLAIALLPTYVLWLRGLALTGLALVFLGLIANTVIGEPPLWRSVCAVSLLFVSWDTAERGISLGEQVDSETETAALEFTSIAATGLVGGVALLLTLTVALLPTKSPSLLGIGALLIAVVAFGLAFFRFPSER
ncbi:uncharacterized protein Nmag_2562 [Natrialba magadii ATCC 43099]|uniref:Uncharacterized protein n=1 Tax=Natrialba magadii (strain ATCC 43099 / DSM 3394 / CCM 3739 / CIP 104546 / IAM 13178 / JCM 8861 / NBRC 102185 / NCIMB 2190 / MS3) TaxID=547559 RepID=D3SYF0_NATMM|nr:hypothetical protein [Natrialba magadii]ADD06121.1 uncharacterized protein Nmag_2562 [Natrialba magadii ATCC 43099]ELY30880.1 hypothetical protein C500_07578 [Natrialba magadii ATCC 43099]